MHSNVCSKLSFEYFSTFHTHYKNRIGLGQWTYVKMHKMADLLTSESHRKGSLKKPGSNKSKAEEY